MEVVNKNVAFLSNCEVFDLLKQTKENIALRLLAKKSNNLNNSINNLSLDKQNINVDKHLPTVVYESLRFLEKTACENQTPEIVAIFFQKLAERKEFKLTKVEKLQLINHRPASAVELQVLIEDSEERFTLDQMDDLLEFVMNNLPANNQDPIESNWNHKMIPIDSILYYTSLVPATLIVFLIFHFLFWLGFQFFINN